jgi:hypothetical protein
MQLVLEREIWGSIQFMECDKQSGGGKGEKTNISLKLSMNSKTKFTKPIQRVKNNLVLKFDFISKMK